jgi:hypothetical protein
VTTAHRYRPGHLGLPAGVLVLMVACLTGPGYSSATDPGPWQAPPSPSAPAGLPRLPGPLCFEGLGCEPPSGFVPFRPGGAGPLLPWL